MDGTRVPFIAAYVLAGMALVAGLYSEAAPWEVGEQSMVPGAGTLGPLELGAGHHYSLYIVGCFPPSPSGYPYDAAVGQHGGSPFSSIRSRISPSGGDCHVRARLFSFEPPRTGEFEVWWSMQGNLTGTGAVLRMEESVLSPGVGAIVAGFAFVVLGIAAALDVRRAVVAKRPKPADPFAGAPLPAVVPAVCPQCGLQVPPMLPVCPRCGGLLGPR